MEDKNRDPDLGVVIRSFKEELKVVFKPFVWMTQTTTRYKLLMFVCITIGAALGVTFYLTQKPYYRSSISIQHERLSNDFCIEMTKTLSDLVGNRKNDAYLAKKLSLDVGVIQNLKSITYAPLNPDLSKFYKDSSNVKLPFKVEVETYDISSFDSLQAGILRYFESNDYALQLKAIDLQLLAEKEVRIKSELKEIDSLKLVVSKSLIPRGTGSGIVFGEPVNPMSLYNSSSHFYEKVQEVRKKMILNNSFYVIVGFSGNAKPAGLGKLAFLIIGAIIGWICGLIIVGLRKTGSGS